MNRILSIERRFEKDLILQKRRGKNLEKLNRISYILIQYGRLPLSFCPHKLSGEYDGLWECHIENDWLLIYNINETEVTFIRTGTHADLFE